MRLQLDLAAICALVGLIAALFCLWVMQAVTADFGVSTPLKVVKLMHRLVFGVLAVLLFANAVYTISTDTAPRPVDLALEIGFLACLVLSAARHMMVPKKPGADLPKGLPQPR